MSRAFLPPMIALAAASVLLTAAPAAAQTERATVTASATVVEPIGFTAGPSTVSASRGGIDVTAPLAVHGRVAHVVQVIHADGRVESNASMRPSALPDDAGRRPESIGYAPVVRLPSRPISAGEADVVAFVVATIN